MRKGVVSLSAAGGLEMRVRRSRRAVMAIMFKQLSNRRTLKPNAIANKLTNCNGHRANQCHLGDQYQFNLFFEGYKPAKAEGIRHAVILALTMVASLRLDAYDKKCLSANRSC